MIQPVVDDIEALIQLEQDIYHLTNFETQRQTQAIRKYLKIYQRVSHRFVKDKNLQLKLKLIKPQHADYFAGRGKTAASGYYKWLYNG